MENISFYCWNIQTLLLNLRRIQVVRPPYIQKLRSATRGSRAAFAMADYTFRGASAAKVGPILSVRKDSWKWLVRGLSHQFPSHGNTGNFFDCQIIVFIIVMYSVIKFE